MALLALDVQDPTPPPPPPRRALVYVPLGVAVFLILVPHPSFVIMLASHYLHTRHAPLLFCTHLLAVYTFTFMAFSSLIVCVVRDPGPVTPASCPADDHVTAALLQGDDRDEDDHTFAGRWCRQCSHPRPERAHHCSTCDRCVLKMDHHCPWLGGNCIGHRTHPAFLHFIFSTTLLAAYITSVALAVIVHLVSDPFSIDPHVTPLHALFLVLMGAVFTLSMGSFLVYHLYLLSTNQTTLEHMSPFLLLRHLPAPPPPHPHDPAPSTPASPPSPPTFPLAPPPRRRPAPEEHELSAAQRRLVQHAHGRLRVYDLGVRRNWRAVLGGAPCLRVLLAGGPPRGDGRTFEKGPGVPAALDRLARALDDVRRREERGGA